jgi:outer membrane protein assembly factor BamB
MPGKVFISHDREDTSRCAGLLAALDAWGIDYWFDRQEASAAQQLSDRVQMALAESTVFLRICTPSTRRSFWMSMELGAFLGLQADDHHQGRDNQRRLVNVILDPGYVREPFDRTTTVLDATDTAHPEWVNALREALGLPPLADPTAPAAAIYSQPPKRGISRRQALGVGVAGAAVLAAAGAGGLALLRQGGATTITRSPAAAPTPPVRDPHLNWAFPISNLHTATVAGVSASPVIEGDTIYVGSLDGHLCAVDSFGRQRWAFQPTVPGKIYTTPSVANGIAYVCIDSVGLFAVSAGKQVWMVQAGEMFSASTPVLADALLYVTSFNTGLFAVFVAVADLQGKPVRSLDTGDLVIAVSPPMVAGNVLYAGASDGYFYAFDVKGPRLWRAETGAAKAIQLKLQNPLVVRGKSAVANGVIYVGSEDAAVYALDARTGQRHWRYETGDAITLSGPAAADGVVYIGSTDHNLYALDAASGALRWKHSVEGGVRSAPFVSSGVVYFGCDDHFVYAVDAKNGSQVAKYETGSSILSQPQVTGDTLYVTSMDGWLYAFHLK